MSRQALAPGHAREYETIYILRPNLEKDVANDVAARVANAIKGGEGVLTQAELWGQRRLAYPIERHHRGTYVYLKFLAAGDVVNEIERQLRLVDSVIRFQTIVLRDNVPMGDVQVVDEDVELDFDIPFEADEPELSRIKELGLDAPVPERRGRRDRRDDRRSDDKKEEAKKDDDKKEEAKKDDDKKSESDDAKAEAKTDGEAKPEADKPEAKKSEGDDAKKGDE